MMQIKFEITFLRECIIEFAEMFLKDIALMDFGFWKTDLMVAATV